jgi:hypothetical protein
MSYSNARPKFVNPFSIFVKMSRLIEETDHEDHEIKKELISKPLEKCPEPRRTSLNRNSSYFNKRQNKSPSSRSASKQMSIRWGDQVGKPI